MEDLTVFKISIDQQLYVIVKSIMDKFKSGSISHRDAFNHITKAFQHYEQNIVVDHPRLPGNVEGGFMVNLDGEYDEWRKRSGLGEPICVEDNQEEDITIDTGFLKRHFYNKVEDVQNKQALLDSLTEEAKQRYFSVDGSLDYCTLKDIILCDDGIDADTVNEIQKLFVGDVYSDGMGADVERIS